MPEDINLPILYSFRRCPYAIRARLALRYAGVAVELREVSLRDKPAEMLACSPKGTVPVLVLSENDAPLRVLEESLDIISWSLAINDPDDWLIPGSSEAQQLIVANDEDFKYWLDRYKYREHYDLERTENPLAECHRFLARIERRLASHEYLFGDRMSVVDIAIFPFVRQFAFVDQAEFAVGPFSGLQAWLGRFLQSELFVYVMQKYPVWKPGSARIVF